MSTSPEPGGWLTTTEASHVLRVSRQHVVDLCDRGELPVRMVGSHRRVHRAEVDRLLRPPYLTKDQRRSLWLGYAVAGKVVLDPGSAVALARRNLETIRANATTRLHPTWLKEWEELLNGPTVRVLEALTSTSELSQNLRQNTPFAGILSDDERVAVLRAFRKAEP